MENKSIINDAATTTHEHFHGDCHRRSKTNTLSKKYDNTLQSTHGKKWEEKYELDNSEKYDDG